MRHAYTVDQIRAAEETAFAVVGTDVLMQRAAAAVATAVIGELAALGGVYGARVLVVTGAGNNGGDGLFAAARLAWRGVRVLLVRTGRSVHEEGWRAARAAGAVEVTPGEGIALVERAGVDLVLDAVLGIGGRPGLREPAAGLAKACARAGSDVIAVDLPSGLDADGCAAPGDAFQASVTVTFGGRKPCHLLEPARSACGRVVEVDIGLSLPEPTLRQWELHDVRRAWPVPGPRDDKYARGVVGIDTGSDAYPGAAILSTTGAVHAGAGMVRFLGAARPAAMINQLLPNVVVAEGRVQSWLIGSGWGDRRDGGDRVAEALATGLPVVLDADALGCLPDRLAPHVLLTPHAGELARLLGTDRDAVEGDPVSAVRAAVQRTGATVLLKGASQLVGGPDDPVLDLAVPGPAWTAQAGSGDTLAGICAALVAAGLPAREAALAGVSLQAIAAGDHPGPVPPQELAVRLPAVLADLLGAGPAGHARHQPSG